MQLFWRRLAGLHDAITSASFAVAAAVLGTIAFSFCYEVAARYFFAAPTSWANAFVSYLLCAAIFLAIPELTRRRAHVAINLLLIRLRSCRISRSRSASFRSNSAIVLSFSSSFSPTQHSHQ
jgi:TRAP-type mannitol/chloroaromatic compound transport system permease small subunit